MTAQLALTRRVGAALRTSLASVGVRVSVVHVKAVKHTQLVRVSVVAPKFAHLSYSERQDICWRILASDLPEEDNARISMIMTFAPSEVRGGRRT